MISVSYLIVRLNGEHFWLKFCTVAQDCGIFHGLVLYAAKSPESWQRAVAFQVPQLPTRDAGGALNFGSRDGAATLCLPSRPGRTALEGASAAGISIESDEGAATGSDVLRLRRVSTSCGSDASATHEFSKHTIWVSAEVRSLS